jgi:hypothetical protein
MRTFNILFLSLGVSKLTRGVISQILQKFSPDNHRASLSRDSEPDRGWKDFLASLEDSPPTVRVFSIDSEFCVSDCPIADIPSYFLDEDHVLSVDLSSANCKWPKAFRGPIMQMDENVRRNFELTDLSINFGWQDVFDGGQDGDDYKFFGRPLITIRFWGWGTPHGKLFPAQFFALEEVKQFKAELEPLCGTFSEHFLFSY